MNGEDATALSGRLAPTWGGSICKASVPNVLYDGEDCTGQEYIPQDSDSIMPLGTTNESFIWYPVEPPSNVLIVSGLGGGGECGSLPNGPREIWVSKAQLLETAHFIPPFTIVP